MRQGQSTSLDWDEDEIDGPDVTDHDTLLTLAKMTFDAYVEPSDSTWYDLGDRWNSVSIFDLYPKLKLVWIADLIINL